MASSCLPATLPRTSSSVLDAVATAEATFSSFVGLGSPSALRLHFYHVAAGQALEGITSLDTL